MKKMLGTAAVVLVAGAAMAATPMAPGSPEATSSRGVQPVSIRTYADAYNNDIGPAHFLVGTSDPNLGPPNGYCQAAHSCPVGATPISPAAYVGSLCINCPAAPNGNHMTTVLAFPADELKGDHCMLRLNNFQNFTGYGHVLNARVLRNRGDGLTDFGAEGMFNMRGPFGVPVGGSAGTIITVVSEARALPDGQVAVPSQGVFTSHPWGPGPLDTYDTYDRTVDIHLGNIKDDIRTAQDSGRSYTSCRTSCLGPLQRNVDCDQTITNPLYIALSSLAGGNRSSAVAIQDGIAVDNIIHLHGDCDFDGSSAPGDLEGGGAVVELICG